MTTPRLTFHKEALVNRSLTVLLTLFIVLAFTCGPVLSADEPVDKSMQAPAKIDKAKTGQSKEKVQSKNVKGKTEKSVSKKTDKAVGGWSGAAIAAACASGACGQEHKYCEVELRKCIPVLGKGTV